MSAPSPTDVAGVFDRGADTYEAVGVPWFGPIAEGLVNALDPRPGERVLDVGCGKGAALLPLAERVGAGGHVTGIDLAPRMVAAAAAEARARGLGHVDVRVDDASAPDLPEQSFEVLASSMVLFFLPDPPAALTAWRLLLRPGGRLGVATFGPVDPSWPDVGAVFTPYLRERMGVAPPARPPTPPRPSSPFTSDAGMEQLVLAAGFEDVRTVTATIDTVMRDPDQWYAWSWSHGQRAMWESVPEGEREAVREKAYAVLEPARAADGSLTLTQQVRYTLGRRAQ